MHTYSISFQATWIKATRLLGNSNASLIEWLLHTVASTQVGYIEQYILANQIDNVIITTSDIIKIMYINYYFP